MPTICRVLFIYFCFNDTATTDIYTLSLHDALPISESRLHHRARRGRRAARGGRAHALGGVRSEEHTSELQSRENLVCRLLLEKKKHKQSLDYVTADSVRHLAGDVALTACGCCGEYV